MPEAHAKSGGASLREEASPQQEEEKRPRRDEGKGQMERIAFALHEACQPLMALQCRLEIGRMIGTPEAYEEAVRESLLECDRLLELVAALRDEVRIGLETAAH